MLKTKGILALRVKIGDLLSGVLFSIVKNLTIDVLLDTVLIVEHILAILSE